MCDHCSCRDYAPIAELTAEHERILALATALADATTHHTSIGPDERGELVSLLRMHVDKEEVGLYPILLDAADWPADRFDELETEHRDLFDAIDAGRFDHLALYALQRHIEEEEEVLFSAAVFHFDGDTWDDLSAAQSGATARS
jgi:hemerythrin-like domain-containing protein